MYIDDAIIDSSTITDLEALASILQTRDGMQIAQALMERFGSLQEIFGATPYELSRTKGIGRVRAAKIRYAFELGKRLVYPKNNLTIVESAKDAANLLMGMIGYKDKKHFVVLHLGPYNHVTHQDILYIGSLEDSTFRMADVFRLAVRRNSASIIVAHNRPSGNIDASQEDIALTKRMVEAGEMIGIDVKDHIIVGWGEFTSLQKYILSFKENRY